MLGSEESHPPLPFPVALTRCSLFYSLRASRGKSDESVPEMKLMSNTGMPWAKVTCYSILQIFYEWLLWLFNCKHPLLN